jgi:hypothetical protein
MPRRAWIRPLAVVGIAIALTGCGGDHGGGKKGAAAAASSASPPAPTREVRPDIPPAGDEIVYERKRPDVPTGCGLIRIGKRVGGPRGAHWLIQPPAPRVRARRDGKRVSVAWSFAQMPRECRAGYIEFTLKSVGRERYFAGGTDRAMRIHGRRGRWSFRIVPTPAGAPYELLSNSVSPDARVRSPTVRTPVP